MSVLRTDAPFYWPLRGSLALQNGSGTSTFTRATAAWGFNETGKLYKVPSGAVRMRGYRAVINLLSNTENLALWSNTDMGPIAATDPDGGSVAYLITAASTSAFIQGASYQSDFSYTIYHKVIIKPDTHAWWRFRLSDSSGANYVSKWVNVVTQTVGGTATNGTGWSLVDFTIAPHTVSGWYVVRYIAKYPQGATSPRNRLDPVDGNSSNNKTTTSGAKLTLWHPQSTNVTWMDTPANAADEYVSVGVLSSPWHGAGADGVKYFSTYEDGEPIPEANLLGARLNPNAVTNNLLYCRDLTNAAWTKTNVTAALTQTGLDGQSNACSLLTATATDGTALQTITAASAAACSGFYVKMSVGTGSIYFTRDGGSNWTDITSSINSTDFTLVKIENTSITNPQVGFKIATSGDAIIVDAGINHLGTQISETPIITTSASVTVNADVLTAQTSGNFSDTAGTILATVTRDDWTAGNGSAVGSATRGLYTSSANSGVKGLDGTNTVNGPTGTPSGTMRIGIRWNNSVMQTFTNSGFGTSGSYDGGFDLASIALAAGVQCTIKDVSIWPYSLTNEDITYAIKDPASIKVSCRSIAVRRSRNRNLSKYFATGYRGVTIGNESNFLPAAGTGSQHVANGGTIANNRQYTCDWAWTGTDSDTGFGPPTGSPLEATSKYGCYLIDGTVGFPTNDHAGVSALATVGFEDATIRGVSCKALRLHVAAPDNTIRPDGYGRQLWRVLQRAITSDLSRMTIQQDIYLPDLTTLLSTSRRRITIFDVKSSDDFRYVVTIIKANSTDAAKYGVPVGTIGWEIIGDNNSNGGLTFEEFFRVTLYNQCAPLDHSVSIPLLEWFGFRVYWKRAASYADTSTGQFVVQIKRSTDQKWVTVWDQNSATNTTYNNLYPASATGNTPDIDNRNIHFGVNGSKIQRIFRGIYGNYETYPVDVLIANEEFWSGLPDE